MFINDVLNTFCLHLDCIGHMAKRNIHELFVPSGSKVSIIYIIPHTETCIPWALLHQLLKTSWN